MKSGQVLGGALLLLGIVGGLGCGAWLVVSLMSPEGGLGGGGAILGVILLVLVAVPVIGAGAFLLMRSNREAAQEKSQAAAGVKQRQLLDMVKTRGQVQITDLVLELKSTQADVQRWVHDLVGMGIFSGYVNWDEGILYSVQASQLRGTNRCKHCGGEVKLAGKGVVTCPYCGTEYFLS